MNFAMQNFYAENEMLIYIGGVPEILRRILILCFSQTK